MTQNEIIRMAREVWGERAVLPFNDLERFAAIVAAHERAKELTGANISLYKLAEEAGFDVAKWAINGGIEVIVYEEGPITGELTRFAALVAAHEREKHNSPSWETVDDAIAAEREACAKVCEEVNWYDRHEAAAAIRARGEE